MQSPPTWLSKFKAVDLHKLAVLIGTPCSGTKSAQIQGIQNALSTLPRTAASSTSAGYHDKDKISLVSIDMGIRNLAYSQWTTTLERSHLSNLAQYTKPVLNAWRKIDISSSSVIHTADKAIQTSIHPSKRNDKVKKKTDLPKESFEPIDYANHAYNFIKSIMDEHQPTHVLIERQRFRSGGNSAVQEWTIRVGVFEGMLYAVLKSLAAEGHQAGKTLVEPMLPTRVNRYWLEGWLPENVESFKRSATNKTAREVKQVKIELVRSLLQSVDTNASDGIFTSNSEIGDVISVFVGKSVRARKRRTSLSTRANSYDEVLDGTSKLDDLADCLLQGLAWLQWQNNRLKLDMFKEEAYPWMKKGQS